MPEAMMPPSIGPSKPIAGEISKIATVLAQLLPSCTEDMISNSVRNEIATRIFYRPRFLLSHAECWRCKTSIPVMAVLSACISVAAGITHEFRDGGVYLASAEIAPLVPVLAGEALALNSACFGYMVTDFQRGFLDWLHRAIEAEPHMAASFGALKVEKRHSRKAGLAYYANICLHCDAQQGDFFLQADPRGPFYPPKLAATLIIPLQDRPLFLRCGLMPLQDIVDDASNTS
ncbi:hypothetical protein [Noviherbaspirillum pedocola]|uniref:Uncharacterized protein n=1 Tax=Noviherbaspirillum pedocola TaxID=2801341 RepID=A0A934SZM5_9BURK|nr:hypothetical protein [Noviherbaspirillum pedocola]MBK4735947.1 hypothetical protein [Noviherbaspirillum pedocola]